MAVQSASELAKEKFEGFTLKGYEERLGFLEPHTAIFIWGSKGSGKSTASLRIAKALAENKGNVIYFTPEEGVGRTMQDKINRVGATHNRLYIADWNSLAELKREVTRKKAAAVFLDSAQMSRLKDAQIEELYQWARVQPVILVIVNHATKTGDYKGNSMFAHMVDIELMVMDGIVSNQKNRCGGQGEWEVDFGSDSTKAKARKNPVPVPFRTTLSELDKRFKIRGAARLNQLAGFQHGCYTKHHKGQKENSVIQFRYDRNTTQKLSTLDLVLDNRIIDSFCEKDFKTAWAKCVKKYHDLSIYITDQAHAKTVLGAAEYRKQERAAKGEKQASTKPVKPKKKEYEVIFTDAGGKIVASNKLDMDSSTNDYRNLALISQSGEIEYKVSDISAAVRKKIEAHAKRIAKKNKAPAIKIPAKTANKTTPKPKSQMSAFDRGMDSLENLLKRAIAS